MQSILSCPAVVLLEERPVLAIPLSDAGRVFVLGGGHVSLALSPLLYHLEFRHIVIDDRAAFCSPERFPHAEHTLCIPFSLLTQTLAGPLSPAADDAFCIMTRGHEGDTDALRFALSTPASYIGVMGSRRKRESVFSLLESEGFLHVRQRVITPIGLAIGAQTPAEIAVSIAAQLIAWRSSKTAAAKL